MKLSDKPMTQENRQALYGNVVDVKGYWLREGNKLLSPTTGAPLDAEAFSHTEEMRKQAITRGIRLSRHYH